MSTSQSTMPLDAIMPALPQQTLILVFGLLIAAAFVHALVLNQRDGDNRLLVLLGCGAAASLLQGFACHLVNCYHSSIGIIQAYEAFDIHVPLWLVGVYVLFFGAMPYYFLERFAKSPTKEFFWGLFAIVGVLDGAGEMFAVWLGMYTYHGPQPFSVLGFPLYLGVINPALAMATALIGMLWFRSVRGARRYLLIPLTPAIMAGLYAGLTFPTTNFLLNGNREMMVFGSIGSMVLSLMLAAFCLRGLLDDCHNGSRNVRR